MSKDPRPGYGCRRGVHRKGVDTAPGTVERDRRPEGPLSKTSVSLPVDRKVKLEGSKDKEEHPEDQSDQGTRISPFTVFRTLRRRLTPPLTVCPRRSS